MDLLDLIRTKIATLPDGPHSSGLNAVLSHIDTAYTHLARGQKNNEESAFTDAIYRTNQAFEGSIKEAFGVLTGKALTKMTIFQIEQQLEESKVFTDRVLSQFTAYRKEWRNPSTHDHKIAFQENEAFLAIVSVSAFIKLLVDQIDAHLSFVKAKQEFGSPPIEEAASTHNSVDRIASLFESFFQKQRSQNAGVPIETEAQLLGSLAGYLSSVAPDLKYTTGRVIRTPSNTYYVDMIVEDDNGAVIIELKRGKGNSLVERGLDQIRSYLSAANANRGMLFLYSDQSSELAVEKHDEPALDMTIRVLRPL